jgi:hypothetical protein
MALARVERRIRYVGVCPEHPHWAVPADADIAKVTDLVREHNDAEHLGTETLGYD